MLDNTQISYIKVLQKASRQNKLVIFAGAGTSVDAGIPLWNTLIDKLTEVLPDEVKHNNRSDNLKLAELFREVSDDKDYYESIESVLFKDATSPNVIHDTILSLQPCNIITTNYDTLFEDAALKNNRQYFVVATDSDLPRNHGEKLIVKMHGDLKHHNIILTENDYYDYSRKFPLIRSFVISQFVSKVVLFVGFSFNDPNLKFILREIQSDLGRDMQHAYLLTGDAITEIERNHQFKKGVNILSINKNDAEQELRILGAPINDDENLKSKGKELVDLLTLIREYHDNADIIGRAIQFAKDNLIELGALGSYWKYFFPTRYREEFKRNGTSLKLPRSYAKELKKLLKDKKSIRKLVVKYGEDLMFLRKVLVDDDIYTVENISIASKAYSRLRIKGERDNSVLCFYNLDQNNLAKRISDLKAKSLSFTIADLELPYILFNIGHFYEAYQIYRSLAPKMWKNRKYALFFIYIFNLYSISRPASRELSEKPGANIDIIKNYYFSINLWEELNQLPLSDGVYGLFSSLINQVQLGDNIFEVNDYLQRIEAQKKRSERGGYLSFNNYIRNVIMNFVTFLDFLSSNYLISDNNRKGTLYYNSVVRCIFNSNLIPSEPGNSKLENLFKATLYIIVLKTDTADLKDILKEIGKEKKLTADKDFKEELQLYVNNLYDAVKAKKGIIEDKILSPIFKNIILISNAIDECPRLEHLEELIGIYWKRLMLRDIVDDISEYFDKYPPKGKVCSSILSSVVDSFISEDSLVHISQILTKSMANDSELWNDNRYLSFIEFHGSVAFAASLLKVLADERKIIVTTWINNHISSLSELVYAEIVSGAKLLTIDTFDKYKEKPFTEKEKHGFGEVNIAIDLFNVYNDNNYKDLKKSIEDFSKTHKCLNFILHPLGRGDYATIKPQWYELLSIDVVLQLMEKNKDAANIIKQQAENDKLWGDILKQALWEKV